MFLLVISVNHTYSIFKISLWILLTRKNLLLDAVRNLQRIASNRSQLSISMTTGMKWMEEHPKGWIDSWVNCIKTYSDGVQLELLKWFAYPISMVLYANHLRSSNVLIQLTHSMLPLSLLILGCYTCSIYRWSLDMIAGTSIATYEGYMSRDNGSEICNIECTSTLDVDVSAQESIQQESTHLNNTNTIHKIISILDGAEDLLYSHRYGLETIKTISNMVKITKNIIIPLINGTGTIFPVMIIFCIRDSLREYKSNYVILSSMKLSLYNWFILSESAIFNLLFWSSYQHILSPLYITINLCVVFIQLCSYELSLKNTNILSNSGLIFGYHNVIVSWLGLILLYLCSIIFVEGQTLELTNQTICVNDIHVSWVFYSIDGCHLYHIIVGNIILSVHIMFYVVLLCHLLLLYVLNVYHVFKDVCLMYWHFVELLWLMIYYSVYS